MNVPRKHTIRSLVVGGVLLATIGAACGDTTAETVPAGNDALPAAGVDAGAVSALDRALMDLERNLTPSDSDEVTTLDRMVMDMVRNLTPSESGE